MPNLKGKLVAGVGFASEAYSHYSERKAQRTAVGQNGAQQYPSGSPARQVSGSSGRYQADSAQLRPEPTYMARPPPENARARTCSDPNSRGSPDDLPPKYPDENSRGYPDEKSRGYPDEKSRGYPDEKSRGYPNEDTRRYPDEKVRGYPDEKRQDPSSEDDMVQSGDNDDERAWELDEAQDEINESAALPPRPTKSKDLIGSFLRRAPPPVSLPPGAPSPELPYPVVIPQRRPKERARGFIRAYAPDLEQFGIDQDTFLDFIESFNEASSASHWIHAINLAQFATIPIPMVAGIVASIAIEVTTAVALEVDGRVKTNASLKRINDEYFRPRGLYCLILTYDPESAGGALSLSKMMAGRGGGWADKLKSSNGKPFGAYEFPETAPLVYPALDYLALKDDEKSQGKRYKLKRSRAFLEDYMDRRAQARFHDENPGHALSGPRPQFRSRFADPSFAAASESGSSGSRDGRKNKNKDKDRNRDRRNRNNGGPLSLIGNVAQGLANGNHNGNQRGGGGGGGLQLPIGNRGGPIGSIVGIVGGLAAAKLSDGPAPNAGYGRNDGYGPNGHGPNGYGSYNGYGPEEGYGRNEYGPNGYGRNDGYGPSGYGPSGYGRNDGYGPNGYGRSSPYDQRRDGPEYDNSPSSQNARAGGGGNSKRGGGGISGGIKKMIQSNVLYMMIVNMPTDQEMANIQGIAAQYARQTQNQKMYNTEGAYGGSSSFTPPPGPPPQRYESPDGYGGPQSYTPPPGPPPPQRYDSGYSYSNAQQFTPPPGPPTPPRQGSGHSYSGSQNFAPPSGPPPRSNPPAPQGYHTPSPQQSYNSSQEYGVGAREHQDVDLEHDLGPPPSYDQVPTRR